jgi:hypothetical protein
MHKVGLCPNFRFTWKLNWHLHMESWARNVTFCNFNYWEKQFNQMCWSGIDVAKMVNAVSSKCRMVMVLKASNKYVLTSVSYCTLCNHNHKVKLCWESIVINNVE